jgi:hypothetical protein
VKWRLGLRVRLTRGFLDRQLARGAAPDETSALALRARQLTSTPVRKTIAVLLGTILRAAAERQAGPSSPLIVDHTAVLAAREQIQRLIELLLSTAALEPRGIAVARLLVRDSRGPLFCASPGCTLEHALSEIATHLQPRPDGPTAPVMIVAGSRGRQRALR